MIVHTSIEKEFYYYLFLIWIRGGDGCNKLITLKERRHTLYRQSFVQLRRRLLYCHVETMTRSRRLHFN